MAATATPDSVLLDLALAVRRGPARERDGSGRRILTAAIVLFASHGYAGTSMRDIAAAAGIRPASIYAHFPSKQRILAEALDEVLHDFHSFILDGTAAGLPPGQQLQRVVRRHVRWQLGFPELAGSWDVLWEIEGAAGNLEPAAREAIAERRERHHALVEALVAALRPSDPRPRLRSEAILSLCDRAPAWSAGGDPEAVADDAWQLVAALLA